MTADQPLDPAAEARIREACGVDHTPGVWSNCRCYSIRAAILADREARFEEIRLKILHLVREGNDLRLDEERAHADALAEALREELVKHSARYGRDPDICARCGHDYPCAMVRTATPLLAALAKHDAMRGSKAEDRREADRDR